MSNNTKLQKTKQARLTNWSHEGNLWCYFTISIDLIQPLALVGKIIPCVLKIKGRWREEKTSPIRWCWWVALSQVRNMMESTSEIRSTKRHDSLTNKDIGLHQWQIGVDYVEWQQGASSVNIFCNIMCAWAHFSLRTWVRRCQRKRGKT